MLDIHNDVCDENDEYDEDALDAHLESIWKAFRQAPESWELLKTDSDAGEWADMFLRYYFEYIGSSVSDITVADAREVAFELIPRKVSVDPAAAPEIVRELNAFWAFLGREFGLPQAGKIQALFDETAALRLKNKLANPRCWGMAKSFFMRGEEAGFDMSTQQGLDAFLAAQNDAIPQSLDFLAPPDAFPIGEVQHTSTKALRKKRKSQRQARKRNRR